MIALMKGIERSALQRNLHKIDILATVQKHRELSRTKAACYSHINVVEGMKLVDELVDQGFLVRIVHDGSGGGYTVMLSQKGSVILKKYHEMLGLLEVC
jgi:predicted transcriptional regulator